jgi:hypothetical protein
MIFWEEKDDSIFDGLLATVMERFDPFDRLPVVSVFFFIDLVLLLYDSRNDTPALFHDLLFLSLHDPNIGFLR